MDADFVAAGENVELIEVEDGVNGVEEGVLAAGASLVDVIDLSALPVADAGWVGLFVHTDKCVFEAKILIYFRFIFEGDIISLPDVDHIALRIETDSILKS